MEYQKKWNVPALFCFCSPQKFIRVQGRKNKLQHEHSGAVNWSCPTRRRCCRLNKVQFKYVLPSYCGYSTHVTPWDRCNFPQLFCETHQASFTWTSTHHRSTHLSHNGDINELETIKSSTQNLTSSKNTFKTYSNTLFGSYAYR